MMTNGRRRRSAGSSRSTCRGRASAWRSPTNPRYIECRREVLEFLYRRQAKSRRREAWTPHPPTRTRDREKPRLVVVGNGMAGVRTVEELLKLAPDLYDITVFGAEPHPELQPHPALAGARGRADARRHHAERPSTGIATNGITLHLGKKVVKIDRVAREVDRRRRHARALRPAAARHRLESLHPADPGQGPAGRAHLPRHPRHRAR